MLQHLTTPRARSPHPHPIQRRPGGPETLKVRPQASVRLDRAVAIGQESEEGVRDRPVPERTARAAVSASTWVWLGLLLVGLFTWTILIVTTRTFRFSVYWPRARLPIETTGMVVATLTAALGYLRYSLSRSPSSLFLALAFT